MAKNVTLSHTFGGLSGTIPLSYLDDDYTNLKDAFASFNAFSNYLVDTGAANAYAASLGAGLTGTITAGLMVQLKIANTNTTASTFAFNGGTAKSILNLDGTAMGAGQLFSGAVVNLMYDGTQYVMMGISGYAGTFTATLTGCTTSPTYTVNYSKVFNVIQLDVPAWIGTSNTTAKTLTGMPAAIRPTTTKRADVTISDNGGSYAAGTLSVPSSGVLTFGVGRTATAGASWTNSGAAEGLSFQTSYTQT